MTLHMLKLREEYFDAVKNGVKTFEIRRADRDFKVGDTLCLTYQGSEEQMKRFAVEGIEPPKIVRYVTYILTHDEFPVGVPEGFVVMGIRRPQE